jgi:hypothetical protein
MKVWIFVIFMAFFQVAIAQKDVSTNYETWWGVMTSVQMAPRWSVWNDVHFVNDLFFIYRTGGTFHNKKDNLITTAGYAWLRLGAPFSDGQLVRTEHRPWGQVVYRLPNWGRWSTSFRFRYDGRFIQNLEPNQLGEGFTFNSRWRFNNALRYRIGQVKGTNNRFFVSMLNESLFVSRNSTNGFPFEHRTHLLGQLGRGDFVYSLGYVVRYIDVNATTARINHGMVFWLSISLNAVKGKQPTFQEFPSDQAY